MLPGDEAGCGTQYIDRNSHYSYHEHNMLCHGACAMAVSAPQTGSWYILPVRRALDRSVS